MRVKILLEERLKMLEIKYEILKIKKTLSKDAEDIGNIQNELKNLKEKKILTEKLISSLTWENWIESNDIGVMG